MTYSQKKRRLAPLVKSIWTIERIPELLRRAKQRLRELDIYNVQFKPGDGWEGWPKYAPYDGIIVTAAALDVPPALLAQLRPGARLVIPLGAPGDVQWLTVLEKESGGSTREERILPVRFVPFTGSGPA